MVLLLTIFFIAVRMRLSVERPGALQHTMEGIDGFVNNLASETISHHPEKFVPYLTALGMFILTLQSDWAGAGPGIAHGGADGAARLRAVHVVLLSLSRVCERTGRSDT